MDSFLLLCADCVIVEGVKCWVLGAVSREKVPIDSLMAWVVVLNVRFWVTFEQTLQEFYKSSKK